MPTPEKEREVSLLEDKFQRSTAMVFTDFRGLSAPEMVELRTFFRNNDLEYRVIKNTLARLAAQRTQLAVEQFLMGPTGVLLSYGDSILPFKLATEMAKRFKEYEIKGGLIEGEIVEAAEAAQIAALPSREELLTRLTFILQGLIRKLAVDLRMIIERLAIALGEVQEQKERGELSPPADEAASVPQGADAPPEQNSTEEKDNTGTKQEEE